MKVRKLLVSLLVASMLVLTSCAISKVASKETTVGTILLSELNFRGENAGIVVPAKFGDISVEYAFAGASYAINGLVVIEYIPKEESQQWVFMLWVKNSCPEAVALLAYDFATGETEYYVYKIYTVPVQATEKEYDLVVNETVHECLPEPLEG